jgi:hypothetical protein
LKVFYMFFLLDFFFFSLVLKLIDCWTILSGKTKIEQKTLFSDTPFELCESCLLSRVESFHCAALVRFTVAEESLA